MDKYIELPQTIEDLKKQLFEICQVNSQKQLAKYMKVSPSTVSRIFSLESDYEYKRGLEVKNIEKIVEILVKSKEINENVVRENIYNLIYDPELAKDKLKEFAEIKAVELRETTDDMPEEKIKTEMIEKSVSENECSPQTTEEKDEVLNKIKEVLEKIAKDCAFCIEGYENSNKNEIGGILYVSHEYNAVFREPHIDKIYGIYLTEANYKKTVHDIAELKTDDGMIILFYDEEVVFDKAWRDDKLEVKNNVLLYCLSSVRKIYVKSTKKDEKKFLKHLIGKEKLLFPHK